MNGIVFTSDRTMEERQANMVIRRAAVIGDRARRTSMAARWVARLAPPTAALACLLTVIAVVVQGPRTIGLIPLAVGALATAAAFAVASRERPVADDVAAELDRAADMGGAFRSAYWFTSAHALPFRGHDAAWRDFHVAGVERALQHVDWRERYRWPSARREWTATAVLVIVTLVGARWPVPSGRASSSASPLSSATASPDARVAPGMPQNLLPTVVAGMRDMKAGRVPSQESLAAIGQALDLAKTSAAAKSQLDDLFAHIPADAAWTPGGQAADYGGDENWWGDDERARDLMSPAALEWAYRDAMARASAMQAQAPSRESASSPRDTVGESQKDGRQDATTGGNSTQGAAVLADTRGEAVSFSSLLFGHQFASGEPGQKAAAPVASSPRTTALTAALRQEVVHASQDIAEAQSNVNGERRATNTNSAALSAALGTTAQYDQARGGQPPAVPDARRRLVHDFFLRSAEAPAPAPGR